MGEKHLESPAAIPIDAMLLFGKDPIPCYIVSMTDEGFCVAVPDVKQYEGNPYLALATKDATYPVKLIRQDAHDGGYSYLLKKTNGDFDSEGESISSESSSSKSAPSRYGFIATFAAMIAGTVCGGIVDSQIPSFNLKRVGEGLANTSSRLNSANSRAEQTLFSEQVGVAIHASPAQVEAASDNASAPVVATVTPTFGPDIPSFQSVAPEKVSEVVDSATKLETPVREESKAKEPEQPLLKSNSQTDTNNPLLDDRKVGRFQDLTKSVCPWLFEAGTFHGTNTIRVSDAARIDLRQFEKGLSGLPKSTSSKAISSLHRTLLEARSESQNARKVPGARDLYVISSDDANVYFRNARDRLELVRVLPVDLDGDGK